MKQYSVALIAVVSALVGGIAVMACYEIARGSPKADDALVRLSDHVTIIGWITKGDTQNAIKLLTLLADADVMRLMEAERVPQANSDYSSHRRRILSTYNEFRRKNAELYRVPDYVRESGRAEYEQNLKKIQTFLDSAAEAQNKSIK
jgi:hypothetical protein